MATNKALFYPSVYIDNDDWLKSSLLFWDEINTIVPESLGDTYNSKTKRILAERGILKPEIVNPDHLIVRELSKDILEFLNTEEGIQLLNPHIHKAGLSSDEMTYMHSDKLGNELKRLFEISPSEMPWQKLFHIEDVWVDGWRIFSSSFVNYYMTLLANRLCEDKGLRLLTNNSMCSNLSTKIKLGIKGRNPQNDNYEERLNQQIAQGILTNLIIERIDFHPSTNVIDILAFKKDNQDSLGLFRSNLKKLLKEIPTDSSVMILKEEVENIYNDEFLPAYNNLKKQLDTSPLKWTCNNFAKIGFFSVGTTSVPLALLGLTVPQALLAGAGISMVSSLISYNIDKQEMLRENPYNYLFEIEKTL